MSFEPKTAMKSPGSQGIAWLSFVAVTLLVILVAAIRWSLAHPYGIHWDEELYLNESHIDVLRLRGGMLLTLAKRLLQDGGGRPPGYRLLALPFLAVFGFRTLFARMVSLACYGFSCLFIYKATRLVASSTAGALAVLLFALSPEVVSASIFFGTDTTLYLATSAMFFFAFASWTEPEGHLGNKIGLGLAIGLGCLAKSSFFPIAIPFLAFWFVAGRHERLGVSNLLREWQAGVVATLVGAPWWVLNLNSAVAYTRYARGFVRNSLGPLSALTWMRWLNSVAQCLLGHGLSILIVLILIVYLRKAISSRSTLLAPLQKAALAVCACGGVPIVLAQLTGTNHLLRHITPALIPFSIGIAVLADLAGWTLSAPLMAVSAILCAAQLLMLIAPVISPNTAPVDLGFANGALPWRTMVRFDQWDWSPVRDIGNRCGIATPKISFLGGGRVFNPPSIQFPWLEQPAAGGPAASNPPNVKWLWRYENGPLDWQKIMDDSEKSDMLITAPHYVGEVREMEDLDNQYNAEFAQRLAKDPLFQGPFRLEMGRFERIEVDVFVKKTLVCSSAQ